MIPITSPLIGEEEKRGVLEVLESGILAQGSRTTKLEDAAVLRLREAGVGTGVFYPIPAHRHSYVRELHQGTILPTAERLSHGIFSLPVHPELSRDDLETIVQAVNRL
jgi:dTDP-4-amino-4,6-dideoxygalactose transaminase